MSQKVADNLASLHWEQAELARVLLTIAQGGRCTSRRVALAIRREGYAVQSGDAQVLTQAGLEFLRRVCL